MIIKRTHNKRIKANKITTLSLSPFISKKMWKRKKMPPASAASVRVPGSKKPRHLPPAERLKELTREIANLEQKINEEKDKFDLVRANMLNGVVSFEGVSAKQLTQQLLQKLSKLKDEYTLLLAQFDEAVVEKAMGRDAATVKVKSSGCPGGCKPENILTDDAMHIDVCTKCRMTFDKRLENNACNLSYADMRTGESITRIGGYKPPNHFSEIVAQFQGKRRATAPQAIVDKIGLICERYHIPKYKITPNICRLFLKQLQQVQATTRKFNKRHVPEKCKKYTDYYKHCPEIAFRLSGIPPPYLAPTQEQRIFALFPKVVEAYKSSPRFLARKKDRKNRTTREDPNNMNYHYAFYKECQMLGYDELLPYIALPKSSANIDDNDENGWKWCCEVNGWEYCPTR